jgi:predicted small secreted protein
MRNQSPHGSLNDVPKRHALKTMEKIMVRKTLEYVAIGGLLLLAACNTVAGAGKDVSSVGKTVTNTADGAK